MNIRSCPLCVSDNSTTYMKPNAWNNRDGIELKRCKQCSFVFSAASLCDYKVVENKYASARRQDLLELAKKENLDQLVQEIVQKTKLKQGAVLDFGAGVGLASVCIQNSGLTPYAIESTDAFRAKHQQLSIASATDLPSLGVQKESFDLIILKDVLEHVDQPVELLAHITEYLKPNGYFYIRVPNVYHYNFHWSIDTKSHINHFTPKHLTKLLERNKLKKVDFVGVYDISTKVGKLYNAIFWRTKGFLPMYHQISLLCRKG